MKRTKSNHQRPTGRMTEGEMKESDIMYERGDYWVVREKDRYTVIKMGTTHGMSDSSYHRTADGLSIAIARCDYLYNRGAKP